MGRFGNVLLVNGEPGYRLSVRRGEVVRFFLTNASNTRTFNVCFGGARMKVIGSDVGRFEREEWIESVVIAPAERYIIEVRFTEPGEVAMINRVQAIDHIAGSFLMQVDTLGIVAVSDSAAERGLRGGVRATASERRRAWPTSTGTVSICIARPIARSC